MALNVQLLTGNTTLLEGDQWIAAVERARADVALSELIGRSRSGRIESIRIRAPVASEDPKDEAWQGYLQSLPSLGLSKRHVAVVRQVWDRLRYLIPELGVPAAGPTPEGSMQLAWDRDRHHFELDMHPDGAIEWFYLDRTTNMTDSGNDATASAPILGTDLPHRALREPSNPYLESQVARDRRRLRCRFSVRYAQRHARPVRRHNQPRWPMTSRVRGVSCILR